MSISWYSIGISQADSGDGIFSGFFSIDSSNVVTSFYNNTDVTTNIFTNTVNNGADSIFDTTTFMFSGEGTNITSISYYSSIDNSTWFNLRYNNEITSEYLISELTPPETIPFYAVSMAFAQISDPRVVYWYSINISLTAENSPFFNGYFSVINNVVTSFYDNSDPSVNIYTNTVENGADSIFNTSPYSFSSAGTNITSIPYYNNDGNTGNDSTWFNLRYTDQIQSEHLINISPPNSDPRYSVFMNFSLIGPICFNEKTKILCLNQNLEEEYIPIENLRKGNFVKSYKHGYRKIDLIGKNPMINNPEKWNKCMYKTKKNGQFEDLIVTGGHSILVDDLGQYKEANDKLFGSKTPIINDKYLLLCSLSNDFVKLENTDLYTYYHFILENNGDDNERFGVWANGILTETPSKKFFLKQKLTLL